MFDNPTIALRGPWIASHDLVQVGPSAEDVSAGLPGYALDLPGDPLNPGCDYEKWAASQWRGSEPTIYAHVATESGVTDRIALQFFFFYPFNDYNNKHETDWERIQLEFAAPDAATALAGDLAPDAVVYSQHYGSERATWGDDKLEIEDDTHPVVYVSAGSHANQFGRRLHGQLRQHRLRLRHDRRRRTTPCVPPSRRSRPTPRSPGGVSLDRLRRSLGRGRPQAVLRGPDRTQPQVGLDEAVLLVGQRT